MKCFGALEVSAKHESSSIAVLKIQFYLRWEFMTISRLIKACLYMVVKVHTCLSKNNGCSGLSGNKPQRLLYLNIWSIVSGTIRRCGFAGVSVTFWRKCVVVRVGFEVSEIQFSLLSAACRSRLRLGLGLDLDIEFSAPSPAPCLPAAMLLSMMIMD